jgi:rhomboid protease GluP
MRDTSSRAGLRECPRCGTETPADVAECAYCGYSPAQYAAAFQEETVERAFARQMVLRSTPLTYLFIGINVGLFVLMWAVGGMGVMSADTRVLIEFGAKSNPEIYQLGQYWRLITSMFLHIGVAHLLFNNYALWIIGQEMEKLYGSARFAVIYTLTGLAGSVASYLYNPSPSAGASGAIFGLFGAMATFAFKSRPDVPDSIRRSVIRRLLPVIAINLVITFSTQFIDQAAHIGGLIAGVLLGLLIPHKRVEERSTAFGWRILMAICLGVILVSFVAAFIEYDFPRLGR